MLLKLNKKLILLCSPEAPIWDHYLDTVSDQNISRIIDASTSTMANWEGGKSAGERKVRKIAASAKAYLKKRVDDKSRPGKKNSGQENLDPEKEKQEIDRRWDEIHIGLTDESVSVYDFGEMLGYTISASQKVIDQEIYKKMPLFRDIYYESSGREIGRATEDFKIFGGVYSAYFERGEDTTIRAVLRVRYILELKNVYAIRAKLNFPRYVNKQGDQLNYHEYDGFLSVKSHNVFWMFEERDSALSDFFYMITERADITSEGNILKGEHLSIERSRQREVVSGRVFLLKENIEEGNRRKFMHSNMDLLVGESYDEVLNRISRT